MGTRITSIDDLIGKATPWRATGCQSDGNASASTGSFRQKNALIIPAKAFHDTMIEAAQYSGKKISGNKTWTAKFASGIAMFENPDLGISPDEVQYIDIYAHVNGRPGSNARVMRRFPIIPIWECRFDVHILDPIITETIFREMLGIAGMFKGIGRYRPANRGTNGRFEVAELIWRADRQLVA
jgi:hypothetical protein